MKYLKKVKRQVRVKGHVRVKAHLKLKGHVRVAIKRVAAFLSRAVDALAASWRHHHQRMTDEPGYAEAFATVVATAVELITGSIRARYVIRELTAAYLGILKSFRSPLADGWA